MDSFLSSLSSIWWCWPWPSFWYFLCLPFSFSAGSPFLLADPISMVLKILTSVFYFSVSLHILFEWICPSLVVQLDFPYWNSQNLYLLCLSWFQPNMSIQHHHLEISQANQIYKIELFITYFHCKAHSYTCSWISLYRLEQPSSSLEP